MGLDIYIKDVRREEVGYLADSAADCFRTLCETAPVETLRSGVMRHGHTVFNSLQLRRFIDELEGIPQHEMSPVIEEVIEASRLAIRRSGYLHIVGD